MIERVLRKRLGTATTGEGTVYQYEGTYVRTNGLA